MTYPTIGLAYSLITSTVFVIIVVVLLIQGFGAYRAKMSLVREEAYRKMAEEALATNRKLAEDQHKIAAVLEDMQTRLAAIEKILREVE